MAMFVENGSVAVTIGDRFMVSVHFGEDAHVVGESFPVGRSADELATFWCAKCLGMLALVEWRVRREDRAAAMRAMNDRVLREAA
jgi:hypothetical protein